MIKVANILWLQAFQVLFINSLPNDKIVDLTKLKALNFADNKINVNEIVKFDLGRVENIVVKGENASFQHFRLFSQCF